MKEVNKYQTGSLLGTIAAVIVIVFILGLLLKIIGWALSAIIPLLVVAALALIIYRLYKGQKIW